MFTQKLKELTQLKAKAAKLEAAVSDARQAELANLPAHFGYDKLSAFIKALKASAGAKPKVRKYTKRKTKAAKNAPLATSARKAGKRSRGKITPEMKAQLQEMIAAGATGSAIASALGVSSASVHNMKKELGLVKARSTTAEAAPEAVADPV